MVSLFPCSPHFPKCVARRHVAGTGYVRGGVVPRGECMQCCAVRTGVRVMNTFTLCVNLWPALAGAAQWVGASPHS